jgi:putative transposase
MHPSVTAKAGVLKVETLNVRGMARNRHLALSVADAGMSRLITFCRYKADWRGRTMVDLDPWFPGSQTCCKCGALHPEMKQLSRREVACDCGNRMGRDRNAAVNHQRYPEEPGEPGRSCAPTRARSEIRLVAQAASRCRSLKREYRLRRSHDH